MKKFEETIYFYHKCIVRFFLHFISIYFGLCNFMVFLKIVSLIFSTDIFIIMQCTIRISRSIRRFFRLVCVFSQRHIGRRVAEEERDTTNGHDGISIIPAYRKRQVLALMFSLYRVYYFKWRSLYNSRLAVRGQDERREGRHGVRIGERQDGK